MRQRIMNVRAQSRWNQKIIQDLQSFRSVDFVLEYLTLIFKPPDGFESMEGVDIEWQTIPTGFRIRRRPSIYKWVEWFLFV